MKPLPCSRPVRVAQVYRNPLNSDISVPVRAYAKLAGHDWTFYVTSVHITIGRSAVPVSGGPFCVAAHSRTSYTSALDKSASVCKLNTRDIDQVLPRFSYDDPLDVWGSSREDAFGRPCLYAGVGPLACGSSCLASMRDTEDVDVDLGPAKTVSRKHAIVYYNFQMCRWEISVSGRNGVRVNGVVRSPCEASVGLNSGDLLEIGGVQFLFLLPLVAGTSDYDSHAMRPGAAMRAEEAKCAVEDDNEISMVGEKRREPEETASPRKQAKRDVPAGIRDDELRERISVIAEPCESASSLCVSPSAWVDPDVAAGVSQTSPAHECPAAPPPINVDECLQASSSSTTSLKFLVEGTPGESRSLGKPELRIDYSLDCYAARKPPYSYAALIAEAISYSPSGCLSLSAIYEYISTRYAYFRKASHSWQNSIRHNLSLNRAFKKVAKPVNTAGKGNLWKIVPDFAHLVLDESKRMRKKGNNTACVPQRHVAQEPARREEGGSALCGVAGKPGMPDFISCLSAMYTAYARILDARFPGLSEIAKKAFFAAALNPSAANCMLKTYAVAALMSSSSSKVAPHKSIPPPAAASPVCKADVQDRIRVDASDSGAAQGQNKHAEKTRAYESLLSETSSGLPAAVAAPGTAYNKYVLYSTCASGGAYNNSNTFIQRYSMHYHERVDSRVDVGMQAGETRYRSFYSLYHTTPDLAVLPTPESLMKSMPQVCKTFSALDRYTNRASGAQPEASPAFRGPGNFLDRDAFQCIPGGSKPPKESQRKYYTHVYSGSSSAVLAAAAVTAAAGYSEYTPTLNFYNYSQSFHASAYHNNK